MLGLQNVQQCLETNKLRAINLCLDECGRFFFFFLRGAKQLLTRLLHTNYLMQMSELLLDKLALNSSIGGVKIIIIMTTIKNKSVDQ